MLESSRTAAWRMQASELVRIGIGRGPNGEGNGSPLQYSCLENPMDGGAWWAAVYGVVQSWTRLKGLSSSSSSRGPKDMLPKGAGSESGLCEETRRSEGRGDA